MSAGWLLVGIIKILGVVIASKQIEFKLTTEAHHCRSLLYNKGNAVPRFCTYISDRFPAILQSVLTC